jgi:glucose-6-phosphate isomerase
MLTVDISKAAPFLSAPCEDALRPALAQAAKWLQNGGGKGDDFLGWVKLPEAYDRDEFARIEKAAAKIKGDSKALVVIGIGGSYLGARGVVECLCSPNYNLRKKDTPNVYFIGNGLSSAALREVYELVEDVDFSVNVISKSGTTTEPAVAFRFFKALLEKKYGKAGAAKRIYATTDRARGALKGLADAEGYETFVVPDDVGGRYSVLTAVGLLPIAVAGVDIRALMEGAADMMKLCREDGYSNPAWQYAAMRNALYREGKKTELLACFEPSFRFMAEWWKQLYGESEGKEQKGIFPRASTSPLTCTPWASTSSRASAC